MKISSSFTSSTTSTSTLSSSISSSSSSSSSSTSSTSSSIIPIFFDENDDFDNDNDNDSFFATSDEEEKEKERETKDDDFYFSSSSSSSSSSFLNKLKTTSTTSTTTSTLFIDLPKRNEQQNKKKEKHNHNNTSIINHYSISKSVSSYSWEHLIATSSRWSDSTLQKHAWARLIWTAFCDNLKLKPFPLNANKHHLGAFMEWLVMTVGYALTSAKDVIVASLYRIHTEETGGEQVPQKIRDTVNLAAKKCKQRAPSCTRSGRMRDACLKDDVIQIITMIPGQNAKSKQTPIRSRYLTKGKPGDWIHMITLEGYLHPPPHINPTADFIYWLNLHLQETHSLCLEEFSAWNLSPQQQATSLCLLTRTAIKHSWNSTNNKETRTPIYALSIRQPYGRAQQRYVKSTAIKSMVANRLVSSSGEASSTSLMDPTLVTKEVFHNLKEPLTSKWSLQTNYELWKDSKAELIYPSQIMLNYASLYKKSAYAFSMVNHEDEVEEEMSQEMEDLKKEITLATHHHHHHLLITSKRLLEEDILQAYWQVTFNFWMSFYKHS
ncbi:hypothetical protein QOT17_017179 [Balamuthia mandrillaris]